MIESPRPPEPNNEPQLAHVDALPTGSRISEFEILNLLGVGGFGMVYRAYDHSLHRTVAIKEYMPAALAGRSVGQAVSTRSSSDQQTLASGLRSFVSEARLLAQFEHPSLVKVYRFWEANNTAYMVMPLYSGMTFRQARSQLHRPPPESWLRTVLWSVLGALKYLHDNNIVHRDVSPDNIFLQDIGPPILLDLGAARRAISDSSQKHTAILKVNYAPIEQYAGAGDMRQGPWTDLYSVAAVVHGCLCNEAPLPATFRLLRDGMPTVASVVQTVESHYGQKYSREFVQALAHALAIQPQDRPQSVQAFSDEMALTAPADFQSFVWREGLGVLQSRVLIGAASGATQPMPSSATDLGGMHAKTIDLQVTQPNLYPNRDEIDPSDLTEPGPLAQDNTSLTSDSVFSGLAGPQNTGAARQNAAGAALAATRAAAAHSVAKPAPSAARGASAPGTSRKYGFLAAVVAAVAVAGAVMFLGGEKQTPVTPPVVVVAPAAKEVRATPEAEIINEVRATPAPVVAVPASAAMRPSAPASAPASAVKTANPANSAGAVAGVPGPSGTPGVSGMSGMPGSANAASAPGVPRKPAAVASAVRVPAAELPSGRAEGEAAPAETRPAAAPDRRGPVENCASNNFLTRPMCIFQECEKPEFARLPYCVENRRRQQENAVPNSNR